MASTRITKLARLTTTLSVATVWPGLRPTHGNEQLSCGYCGISELTIVVVQCFLHTNYTERVKKYLQHFLPCDCERIRTVLVSTSLRLSVKRVYCDKTKQQSVDISSPYDVTAMFLVSSGQIS